MKTKLVLNHSEYKALYELFKGMFSANGPLHRASTMQELLLRSILEGVFKKLHNKEYSRQSKYSFHLNTHEAIAFYMHFQTLKLNPASYEANMIMQINGQINREFSTKIK